MLNGLMLRQTDATLILNIEMFSSDVTPVRIMLNMEMLNRPLSKMQNNSIELCNCSFHIQFNLIKNPYYFCINITKKSFHVTIYKQARIWSKTRTQPTLLL